MEGRSCHHGDQEWYISWCVSEDYRPIVVIVCHAHSFSKPGSVYYAQVCCWLPVVEAVDGTELSALAVQDAIMCLLEIAKWSQGNPTPNIKPDYSGQWGLVLLWDFNCAVPGVDASSSHSLPLVPFQREQWMCSSKPGQYLAQILVVPLTHSLQGGGGQRVTDNKIGGSPSPSSTIHASTHMCIVPLSAGCGCRKTRDGYCSIST